VRSTSFPPDSARVLSHKHTIRCYPHTPRPPRLTVSSRPRPASKDVRETLVRETLRRLVTLGRWIELALCPPPAGGRGRGPAFPTVSFLFMSRCSFDGSIPLSPSHRRRSFDGSNSLSPRHRLGEEKEEAEEEEEEGEAEGLLWLFCFLRHLKSSSSSSARIFFGVCWSSC